MSPMNTDSHDDEEPLLRQQARLSSYEYDPDSEEHFILRDGRRLGFALYGAKTGPAVFYLHGYPGCRFSGSLFLDGPGKAHGARIIAVDRPGIGNSSPQPGRTLLDHANDIGELAEHLKLDSYGVIGVSGGGPYALASAYALPPERLRGVSVIGGMGPIDVGMKDMSWGNWLTFMGLLYVPWVIRLLQRRVVAVLNKMPNEKIVDLVSSRLSGQSSRWLTPDLEALKDTALLNAMLDAYREHYKQGIDGHMEEGRVLTSDWGFRLESIRDDIPIQLWCGKKDSNVPLRMGEVIAARLNGRPDFFVEDETHLNLVLKYSAQALERLLEKM